ncbi:MAG: aminopeptidase [Chryseotalea sp. WA131a]|nr:MAG: aminopeptidase [Chryseotalea sp. WA131a]
MIKKIFFAVVLVVAILVVWNWSLVYYGIRQGMGQLEIVWNARPVEEFLQDPSFPDSLKQKLRLIDEIRKYAIDSLGLKDTKNYKTLYDQKNQEVMWVVQACEPFALQPKVWDFPIVGTVPYKGFFNKEKALGLRKELETEGYDVSVRNPGGWSTLGWFTDPILSGMLDRSEGDLASLIIHEMVHATVFVKDDVDFNENLADFIGDTAAYYFLKYKFGADSKQYLDYLHSDQDYRKFTKHILRGTQSLDSLYNTLRPQEPIEQKKEKKRAMIEKIVTSIDTLNLYTKRKGERMKKYLPNNTFFMSYRLYKAKQDVFGVELAEKFNGDMRSYLKHLTNKYPFL